VTPLAASRVSRRRGARVSIPAPAESIRCAIYTRKSTNEGLDGNFTTLDVQRQAAEAYIASQGWLALTERYDDGGFSGGTMDRPALKRLLSDIEQGHIDCIVVHKIDRLSRSLLDFVRLAEVFEARRIGLVSVTQQISTTSSAGRLMLNVLFSFAQFEREIIGERTSAAMSAARLRGRWCGGPPVLGYTIAADKRLVIVPDEAETVRELFGLYLEHESLMAAANEATRRGLTTKSWTTKKGTRRPGRVWNKADLQRVITNVTYVGQVLHKGEVLPGEHEAIVDQDTFDRVQAQIRENGNGSGGLARNKHGAVLRGLLRCGSCGAAMSHHYAQKGSKLYRYYVDTTAQKRGRDACPTPSLPAQEIEDFVVDQIRKLARDPDLAREAFEEASRQQQATIPRLKAERTRLQRERQHKGEEIKRIVAAIASADTPSPSVSERLSQLEESVRVMDQRLGEIDSELAAVGQSTIDPNHVATTLAEFNELWDVLYPQEKTRIVHLLVERVTYMGDANMRIVFAAGTQSIVAGS